MSKIPKLTIERILERVQIEEVIGDCLGWFSDQNRGGLKRMAQGIRYTAVCPFHTDHNFGNFMVYPKKNCWKCFACGAKGGAVDFLMKYENMSYPDAIRWLGKKYQIPTDMDATNITLPPPRPLPPPLPTLTLPMEMVRQRETPDMLGADNLVRWIEQQPWDYVARHRVDKVLKAYHVGHSTANDMTIFWQIDENKRVRTGKMMLYKTDGHRNRTEKYNFDWIHSALARRRYDTDPWPYPKLYNPDKQEARPCLFGLHLLDAYGKDATVCIVESEKTAILMAIQYGNHAKQVWMACGGICNLSREKLKPIIDRHRRIVLYPDRDGIANWRIKMEQLHYDNIAMHTEMVLRYWQPEDGLKADIADVVIRLVNNARTLTDMDQVTKEMPQAAPLIDKLNLELDNGEKETETKRSN